MKTNFLNIEVTRPSQELILMRGIPSSGKSTKAKQLVGNGSIHSTDDVIESISDYNTFFRLMNESENFTPLSRAHSINFKNVKQNILAGVSPVIVDNTNIKKSDLKEFVRLGLQLGLADENIKFEDVGTGGLSAKELFQRNTHGVPLEKIEKLINSHKGQGLINIKTVMEAKDLYKDSDILYSAVVLDEESKRKLLRPENYNYIDPQDGWIVHCHHMTIAFGKGVPNKEDLGKEVILIATHVGFSDMAMAVKVTGYPSNNEIPHITMFVHPDGKPVMSNQITKWQDIKPFRLKGIVTEIKKTK